VAGGVIHPLRAVVFGPGVSEAVPLSDSVLCGVPCLHRPCFSRPRMVFQAVVWGTE